MSILVNNLVARDAEGNLVEVSTPEPYNIDITIPSDTKTIVITLHKAE